MGDKVASVVVWQNSCKSARLPNKTSIFGAELYAIVLALDVICRRKEKDFLYFFLTPCQAYGPSVDLTLSWILCRKLLKTIHKVHTFWEENCSVLVGSQVVSVSQATRELTLQLNRLFHFLLLRWNFQLLISFLMFLGSVSKNGRTFGITALVNKLYSVYPTVGRPKVHHNKILSRHEAVINLLSTDFALVIPTWLTHLLSGDDPPTCNSNTSTHSPSYITGMSSTADCSIEIFLCLILQRLILKYWESLHYWFYERNSFKHWL